MKKNAITVDDIADYEGHLLWMAYYYEDQVSQKAIDMIANDAAAIELLMAYFFFDGDPEQARIYVVTSILRAGMVDDAPDDVKETFDEFQRNVLQTALDCHLNIDPCIDDYREDYQPEEVHTGLDWTRELRNPGFERHMGRRWRK